MGNINHKLIADDTLQIMEQGNYVNLQNEKIELKDDLQKAVDNTKLYTPEALDQLLQSIDIKRAFTTKFEVTNETTLDAARRLKGEGNLMALNFASAKNAGGGFLRGAVAQEESIARASGLYPCLLKAPEYYNYHRTHKSFLYSDHMIYSPGVPVFKYEDGSLMDHPVNISVVTSAAVNAGELRKNESNHVPLIEPVMRTRIEKMLAICYEHNHSRLILGAWGCGVFQNDPEMIATLFHESLNGRFASAFESIYFAVKTKNEEMLESFSKRFA